MNLARLLMGKYVKFKLAQIIEMATLLLDLIGRVELSCANVFCVGCPSEGVCSSILARKGGKLETDLSLFLLYSNFLANRLKTSQRTWVCTRSPGELHKSTTDSIFYNNIHTLKFARCHLWQQRIHTEINWHCKRVFYFFLFNCKLKCPKP